MRPLERDADGKIPPDVVADLQELHETLDDELAALSTNSTHVVVPGASHFVQDDEPQAVADAIAAAVETARDGGSIASGYRPAERAARKASSAGSDDRSSSTGSP